MSLCALCLSLLSLAACAPNLKELAGDHATACGHVTTPWGAAWFARTNIVDGNVTCNPDGMTVKSNGAQVGVPLTVVPTVTLGAPTITPR